MMKKIGAIASVVIFFAILSSGILSDVLAFCVWLLMLEYSKPETSIFGDIIVRLLTFAASYGLVGLFFETVGLFDKKAMKTTYAIVSTIFGFVFAYIVWTIEEHILIIGIIIGLATALAIAFWIINSVIKKKKSESKDQVQQTWFFNDKNMTLLRKS